MFGNSILSTKLPLCDYEIMNNLLTLSILTESLNAGDIKLSCDIFLDESLSLLLFCLALIPLSILVDGVQYGCKIFD